MSRIESTVERVTLIIVREVTTANRVDCFSYKSFLRTLFGVAFDGGERAPEDVVDPPLETGANGLL